MCRVSILVPVCNVERYLRQCMDSLVHQTLRDIEIICINDGSTDGSAAILREYRDMDSRVRVIDKENTGYGHSMNCGLDAARGEYVGIVESDDFASPDMFERLYAAASEGSYPTVRSNLVSVCAGRETVEEPLACFPYAEPFAPLEFRRIFYLNANIWAAIYRRDFLRENGIRFHETPGASYQDVSFCFEVLSCADRVYLVQDAFLHYRTDNESSSVHSKGKVFCIFDEFDEIERFLAGRPHLDARLAGIARSLKWQKCQENLIRISGEYREMFIRRLAGDFAAMDRRWELDPIYWEPDAWREMRELIRDRDRVLYNECVEWQRQSMLREGLLFRIRSSRRVYLYGAGRVARSILGALSAHGIQAAGLLVSSLDGNEEAVLGVPVCPLGREGSDRERDIVLVAVRESDIYGIVETLRERGYTNVVAMDMALRKIISG